MSSPDALRHVEIKDGDQTVAAAEVTTSPEAGGTAQVSLHAASGHIAPGRLARLVNAVLDLPEVLASGRLEATAGPRRRRIAGAAAGADRRRRDPGGRFYCAGGRECATGRRRSLAASLSSTPVLFMITAPSALALVTPRAAARAACTAGR